MVVGERKRKRERENTNPPLTLKLLSPLVSLCKAVVEVIIIIVVDNSKGLFEVFLGAFLSKMWRPCYVIYHKPTQPSSRNNVCHENKLKNAF